MIRNIKALGLALVAVFAMSVLAASAAQAEGEGTPDFWAAEYPATIKATTDPGAGKQVFTSKPLGGKVRCNDPGGVGTLGGRSNELTAEEISFTGECKGLGIFPATVDSEGCHFTFTVETTVNATTSTGSVHLVCPGTSRGGITVTLFPFGTVPPHETTPVCTIHIPEGQTFGGITYHNIETKDGTMHVTVEANVSEEIEASYEGEQCEGLHSTEDSFEGTFIASAENEETEEAIDTTITDT